MFGNHLVAVKINSQKHAQALDDWRTVPTQELELELHQLLPSIQKHEEAYFLLKKLSGKDYSENNIKAWEHWGSAVGFN